MSKDEYSVVVEMDDDTPPPVREELEFQDFSSGSDVGGKIVQDNNKQTTTDRTGFNDTGFYDPHRTIRTESQGGSYPLWSIEYYAQYFDVDTAQVIERAYKSLYPKDDFVNVVGSNPDLYGPFWITTTVIFLLFVTSSIAGSIAAFMSNESYTYDFKILSFGVAALYTYTFGISLLLWITLKYFGCKPSFLDIVDLYGYGLTIWIPISIVCVVPHETLRWSMVAIGFVISGFFMLKNLYPVILRADAKTTRLLLIFVLVIHAGFALLLKFKFFSYDIEGVVVPGA